MEVESIQIERVITGKTVRIKAKKIPVRESKSAVCVNCGSHCHQYFEDFVGPICTDCSKKVFKRASPPPTICPLCQKVDLHAEMREPYCFSCHTQFPSGVYKSGMNAMRKYLIEKFEKEISGIRKKILYLTFGLDFGILEVEYECPICGFMSKSNNDFVISEVGFICEKCFNEKTKKRPKE